MILIDRSQAILKINFSIGKMEYFNTTYSITIYKMLIDMY